MDNNTFMGFLIAALVVLLGAASVITTLIVKPLLNLNKNITALNYTITDMSSRLKKNDEEIIDLQKGFNQHETRITVLERK